MLQPLHVVYLHAPADDDGAVLPEMEYGLSDAFRAFCKEAFSNGHPLDFPRLKLLVVRTPQELSDLLFDVEDRHRFVSDAAQHCCLFLFDDALPGAEGEAERPVQSLEVDGMPLARWFLAYFPALPKVVLERPGRAEAPPPTRRWTARPAEMFRNPAAHRERLVRLFRSFWLPRFWTALREYVCNRAGSNWHTPGHNGGRAFDDSPFLRGFHDAFGDMSFRADLSVSVERLGDLSSPEGPAPLAEAQRLASEIFGSAQTAFITNGTSTSNKAMLMTLLRPGETVLLDRNCHKSVHHAVVLSGAVPRYLPARYNARYGVWGPVALEDIRAELERPAGASGPPRLLVLTTCTYEGVLYPAWEVARLCEEQGVLFYADEAWAPYLAFHPFYTWEGPDGAPSRYAAVNELRGAHFAVQSTHKALAAFSQASMIHVSTRFRALLDDESLRQFRWLRKRFALHGRGSFEKFLHDLHEVLRYWHSTSPHYPMLATLDTAGVHMRLEGLSLLEDRLHWVAAFKRRVADMAGLPEADCFPSLAEIAGPGPDWEGQGYLHDPLKLLLSFRTPEARERFERALLRARIQWEKASPATLLFLVTAGTVEEHFEYLYRVCREHAECIGRPERECRIPSIPAAIDEQVSVLPRDAALCDGELVPLAESEGRVCGQLIVPYPPGIPVLLPGLRITRPMIDLLMDVVATEGPAAVHGLFVRGKSLMVEVLARDEESRVARIP
ncbi:MAG: aminotransferase class I/II-fold pyridoxal phosphate-dependent enzyme [Kiritimatiellae bacterium]|nr:aminotransferase class I/II-fold pyridoxal phosphate-dependent enzyme [Kiritimatiellia bacterium]